MPGKDLSETVAALVNRVTLLEATLALLLERVELLERRLLHGQPLKCKQDW